MSPALYRFVNDLIIDCSHCLPRAEFARRARSLNDIGDYKAVEFRQILIYIGIAAFRCLPPNLYEHFLEMAVPFIIMTSPKFCYEESFLTWAEDLLSLYHDNMQFFQGRKGYRFNLHAATQHLVDDARHFGCIDEISCFWAENYWQVIGTSLLNSFYRFCLTAFMGSIISLRKSLSAKWSIGEAR